MESVYEIAVYLHSFLNLDLFSQGFYAIKIRCWLDDPQSAEIVQGVPARVVQYGQVKELDPSRVGDSFWRLEEKDKSFTSRIFWIKYARQDVLLQEMVAFNLVVPEQHAPPVSGFVINFDLLHGTTNKELPQGVGTQQPPETLPPVASQSFRILPPACSGLHSYCAVQFNSLHLTLLDVSVHCTLLDIQSGGSSRFPDGNMPSPRDVDQGQSGKPSLRLNSRVRALQVEPLENPDPSFHEIRPGGDPSPKLAKSPPGKQPPFSKTLDGMLCSVLPPQTLSPKRSESPSSTLRRRSRKLKSAQTPTPPPEVDYAAALERWSEAREKLQADLNELRALLAESGVSMTSAAQKETERGAEDAQTAHGGVTTAWEWSARIMRKCMKGLWTEFLELHREHPRAITMLLRDRWRDSRAAEWSFWTVNPDVVHLSANPTPAPSIEREHSSRRAKFSRVGSLESARVAELHRKGIGDSGGGCLLQDLSLFQHPERHPILFTERHVAGQQWSSFRPTAACHVSSTSSSPPSFTSTPLHSPPDSSPSDSPPFSMGLSLPPGMETIPLPTGGAFDLDNVGLSAAVKRFLAETPPLESYEVLLQEMARVSPVGVHVVVFVHGFQGHHLDLRLIRDHWLVLDPSIEPLMSKSNQDLTFEPLQNMGARLATEVADYFETTFRKLRGRSPLSKLSFVGHSLGNLIIRSALTHFALTPFLEHLHTCLSISGPHLGYLYSGNALFNSGLWVMKRFKNSECMHQLTFSDAESIEDCYLYRLSQQRTLDLFKNVVLVASPQDRYVPYHSARIEMCSGAIKDLKRGPAYAAMIMGCMGALAGSTDVTGGPERSQTLLRCDVNFDPTASSRTFSSMLGRTAHIELLMNDVYIRCLLWTHKDYFL